MRNWGMSVAGLLAMIALSGGTAAAQVPKPKQAPVKPTANKAVAPTATLLVKCDIEAVVTLDGEPLRKSGEQAVPLSANEVVKKSVPLGEHVIEAATVDGRDKWKEVLAVEKTGQKVVLIELDALRAAREAKEAQARKDEEQERARVQREEQRAAEEKAERGKRDAEARAEKDAKDRQDRANREKADQLQRRISELEHEADMAENAARSAAGQADQYERDAQRYESQGNGVSASISRIGATNARSRQRSKEREAQRLRTDIRQLERELSMIR
jgi:hypothetical protein